MKKTLLALAFAVPFSATAENQAQLVEKYSSLAGSTQNATSLVAGLRDGKEVKLTRNGATETFTPPTGKMGYGNIDNALSITKATLAKQGITEPSPAQLEAGVMDVLKLRADGMGWGRIAQEFGFKLGELKRPERVAAAQRPERPAKPEKPERPERPEKPERPGKGR